MPSYYSEERYNGPEAISVAMDIGTTQSGVSFVHFSPGSQSGGQMVTQWPDQAYWTGGAKVPTMVSYQNGALKACGAEALQDFDEYPDNVAYWFKLHLHPAAIFPSNPSESETPPLPAGVTIEQVYADFMRYLMVNTQRFFEVTTPNGAEIWARSRDTMVIVLATPNGWDIREQAILRKAAIKASLVTEGNAGQLLQFVTEAEASVHYVLAQHPSQWLRNETVFAVVDCGGSTIDTAIYRCMSTTPLSLNETCPGQCVQAGSIFVNRGVQKLLEAKLKGSKFNSRGIIKSMTDAFERDVKPKFNGVRIQYDLKFGSHTDSDSINGIDRGRITLSNEELRPIFDAVINRILVSCSGDIIKQKSEYVLLVGGFGESSYLRKILSQKLIPYGIMVLTVGPCVKQAAAEGAIISHIKQVVVARAARATFGGCVRSLYDKNLHRERRDAIEVYADGNERVDGAFHVWITKGTVLQGTFAHKLSYHVAWDATATSKAELVHKLGEIGIEVFAWEGGNIPIWCKDEHGKILNGMRLICTLNANLSALAGGLQTMTGRNETRFYRVDYDVCVYFGGTQLRAKLQWREKGVLREGPVTIMPYVS
ncbi:hypothetical protein M408DRAFT_262258 [Serendipita vermifera MAFF 305830]|uniref:Uncharacterized protein n=1 Tax=Serendipita vermifera MAFF 305830 TaxID=933852 RepID=A0A0C3AW23_SERVB|nr:hypothetical protein M408DRAFT_262258 [Serendipita vermifera MAFF 305830]